MTYEQPASPQPTPPQPQPWVDPTPPQSAGGLAIAALIVGIAAFVFGLVPVFGLILGIVGVVLAILAFRSHRGRGLALGGLIGSILAILTNIVLIIILIIAATLAPDTADLETLPEDEPMPVTTQAIDTPCYSFEGPASYINDVNTAAIAGCSTQLELWGELAEDGTFTNTGVGAIWGTVTVEPIRVATSDEWSDGTLDGTMEYLNGEFIPSLGTVITDERGTLGGQEANITVVDSTQLETTHKAAIVAYGPNAYTTESGDVQLMVISFTTVEDDGEEILQQLLDTWEWK